MACAIQDTALDTGEANLVPVQLTLIRTRQGEATQAHQAYPGLRHTRRQYRPVYGRHLHLPRPIRRQPELVRRGRKRDVVWTNPAIERRPRVRSRPSPRLAQQRLIAPAGQTLQPALAL